MTPVFLDANVLYSNTIRSLFIWLYKANAIRLLWSKEVWQEAIESYARENGEEAGQKFRESMGVNAIGQYPECMVQWTPQPPVGVSDPDDEHVVAAAQQSGAIFLVTIDNVLLKFDFTNQGIVAALPDDVVRFHLIPQVPALVIQAVFDHISSLQKSRPSKAQYFDSLARNKMEGTLQWLQTLDQNNQLFPEVW